MSALTPVPDTETGDLFDATPEPLIARPKCYEDIKELAKTTGRKISDLLAMACQNDPFYVMPVQAKQADWFLGLWSHFNLPPGVHLRRIHYLLVVQPTPFLMSDGAPYLNTVACWNKLGMASKSARILGLVDVELFEDHRNPDPILQREYGQEPWPRWSSYWSGWRQDERWELPAINADLSSELDWAIPGIDLEGYQSTDHDQPFHLELISEKSTMDDIIIPLCRELRINYAPAIGFLSITGSVAMLQRLRHANKPCVVFYISDFDPAGSFMPQSVARQLEFWRDRYAPDLDILLDPLILTREQVQDYNLPPAPVKDSDKRQDNFFERYGVAGATELDALEALRPGELAKVIRQAVAPYRDANAANQSDKIYRHAVSTIGKQWREISHPYRWRLRGLKERAAEIIDGYQERLESLRDELADELEPIGVELQRLRHAVKADLSDFDPLLPDRYATQITLPEQFDGLFDSRRDYLTQLSAYKARGTEATS